MKTDKKIYFMLLLIFAGIIAVLLFATENFTTAGAATTKTEYQTLSQMPEKECLDFIVEKGVIIPNEYADDPGLGSYVKYIIGEVEADPDHFFCYNYDVALHFAENVQDAVNDFYGTRQKIISLSDDSVPYVLQDSWVKDANGNWVSSGGYWDAGLFQHYNCYAYAIGRTEFQNYPDKLYFQHQPGYFAGTGSFTPTMTTYNFAKIVKDDLEYLGYGVEVTSGEPADLDTGDNLICVRRSLSLPYDYHFMRYDASDGYWYHKPGQSAILKYKYPPAYKNWTNESYKDIGKKGNVTYDSAVYYITYSERQTFTTSVTGGNATITGMAPGVSLAGSIALPATVDDIPVTAIAANAFIDQTALDRVVIHSGITSIGRDAFANTGIWNNTPSNSIVYADKWVVGCKGTPTGSLALLSNTVGIAADALRGCNVTELTMPDALCPSVLWATAKSPPAAILSKEYRTQFYASSSFALPVQYSVTAGTLPPGLALDPDTGIISGIVSPSAMTGIYDPIICARLKTTVNGAVISQSKAVQIAVFYVPSALSDYDFYCLETDAPYVNAGSGNTGYCFVAATGVGGNVTIETWGQYIYYNIYSSGGTVLMRSYAGGGQNFNTAYLEAGEAYLIEFVYLVGGFSIYI